MNANANNETRAYWWRENGRKDALQNRESLAAVLDASGDTLAADNYREGWREGIRQLVA